MPLDACKYAYRRTTFTVRGWRAVPCHYILQEQAVELILIRVYADIK
jgi:hypothetical protein